MLRAYCSTWEGGDPGPELDREEIHHLTRVRRVREGETVEVINGRGLVGTFAVRATAGRSPSLQLIDQQLAAPPFLRMHLLVALPKGKIFSSLLHKAVELGVAEITPLLTDHAEVDANRADAKHDRWEAILIEAVKQSGNPWKPVLNEPVSLTDALARPPGPQRLCAALQPDARPLWQLLGNPLQPRGAIEIFVGPEGDFSGREYALLREAGCRFASLGPLVLKVETAASLVAGTLGLWAQA